LVWNDGHEIARWKTMDGKRRLRIVWGAHKWELMCNGIEVMQRKVALVARGDEGIGVGGTVSGGQV
jgi:hypothetical protein